MCNSPKDHLSGERFLDHFIIPDDDDDDDHDLGWKTASCSHENVRMTANSLSSVTIIRPGDISFEYCAQLHNRHCIIQSVTYNSCICYVSW